MGKKIAILTDSSSSLYQMKHSYDNIFMIDIPCFIGDEIYTDFAVNKDDKFYEALGNTTLIAKTSQPSVGETLEKFKEIKALGYTNIIYLPISKELSGTYQNGYLSKGMISDIDIDIVDTKVTASILSAMAFKAAEMAKEDKSVKEIITEVMKLRENSGYFVTVSDLTSLVKNGRLSNAKSIIANLLRIKPVIELNSEGKLVSLENVRSYKKAIRRVYDHVKAKFSKENGEFHLAYTTVDDTIDYLKNMIKEDFPEAKILAYPAPSTIVAHIGLKAIALGYINYKN